MKDVFHVAGDTPDPEGGDLRGVSMGYDMTKSAQGRPKLHYVAGGQELVLEADVYAMPGTPSYIILLCPRCLARGRTQGLNIRQDRKHFSYEPDAVVPPFPGWSREQMAHAFPRGAGGLLSVDEFACTWEESPELERGFGLSRCGWHVAIKNNVVRDV